LLLFNPNANRTSAPVRDVIASALASEFKLDLEATKQRGHAIHVAAGAVQEGVDVIFTLGGDGTANEVMQAIAGTPVMLGVIPGGSTNVLARNLGLPNDAVAATAVLLERIRERSSITVGLGLANGRYFAVNAGFGFDAAVVRLVERRARLKRAVRQLSFVWCGLQEFFFDYDRSHLPISIEVPGQAPRSGYGFAIVCNTTPYTYLGQRPRQVTPDAAFALGLDAVGVRSLRARSVLRVVGQVLTTAGHLRSRFVDHWHDQPALTIRSEVPLPLQVDGDYAGEWREVTFSSVPAALRLVA
ncbi:MAG TPA: diacylglycerol kinase family protein, partial [Solirubrobacteraceae bacterium]|nr:diacylglycerol kinase family protein [Solirubrobacteraceae bacterium]